MVVEDKACAPLSSAPHVVVWQASGLDLGAQFWMYAFYRNPPIWNSQLKSKHLSVSLLMPTIPGLQHMLAPLQTQHLLFLHPEPRPAGTSSLDGMCSVGGKMHHRKPGAGALYVHRRRRRTFQNGEGLCTLSWMWTGRFNRPLVQCWE